MTTPNDPLLNLLAEKYSGKLISSELLQEALALVENEPSKQSPTYLLPSYLIDKHCGEPLSTTMLHQAFENMLSDPLYQRNTPEIYQKC